VSPGQREAGHALGMRPARTFRLVILPQALRLVIAPLGNQFLVIMKDTALVSTLSVAEMTFQARLLIDRTAAAYEVFLTLALFYLVLNGLLAGLTRAVEWHLRPRG
jgi:ABC-type amino acid transport system permease subunit